MATIAEQIAAEIKAGDAAIQKTGKPRLSVAEQIAAEIKAGDASAATPTVSPEQTSAPPLGLSMLRGIVQPLVAGVRRAAAPLLPLTPNQAREDALHAAEVKRKNGLGIPLNNGVAPVVVQRTVVTPVHGTPSLRDAFAPQPAPGSLPSERSGQFNAPPPAPFTPNYQGASPGIINSTMGPSVHPHQTLRQTIADKAGSLTPITFDPRTGKPSVVEQPGENALPGLPNVTGDARRAALDQLAADALTETAGRRAELAKLAHPFLNMIPGRSAFDETLPSAYNLPAQINAAAGTTAPVKGTRTPQQVAATIRWNKIALTALDKSYGDLVDLEAVPGVRRNGHTGAIEAVRPGDRSKLQQAIDEVGVGAVGTMTPFLEKINFTGEAVGSHGYPASQEIGGQAAMLTEMAALGSLGGEIGGQFGKAMGWNKTRTAMFSNILTNNLINAKFTYESGVAQGKSEKDILLGILKTAPFATLMGVGSAKLNPLIDRIGLKKLTSADVAAGAKAGVSSNIGRGAAKLGEGAAQMLGWTALNTAAYAKSPAEFWEKYPAGIPDSIITGMLFGAMGAAGGREPIALDALRSGDPVKLAGGRTGTVHHVDERMVWVNDGRGQTIPIPRAVPKDAGGALAPRARLSEPNVVTAGWGAPVPLTIGDPVKVRRGLLTVEGTVMAVRPNGNVNVRTERGAVIPNVKPELIERSTPDANTQGQVESNSVSEYPRVDEVGPPAEAGGGNRPVGGGQVPPVQAEAQGGQGEVAPAQRMTFDVFEQQYTAAFEKGSKYKPGQIGFDESSAEMARLSDLHPEWADAIESRWESRGPQLSSELKRQTELEYQTVRDAALRQENAPAPAPAVSPEPPALVERPTAPVSPPAEPPVAGNGAREPWHVTSDQYDTMYPRAGTAVDGREVRPGVPNESSIDASISNATVVPGIREIPMSEFDESAPSFYSPGEKVRTERLAEEIKTSGEISPLIVVYGADGPYILEGGHRFDALKLLGAKSFPARVVFDEGELYSAAQEALAAGKPVPPEVLAEYPDLAAKYAPAGESATPAPTPPVAAPAGQETAPGRALTPEEPEFKFGFNSSEEEAAFYAKRSTSQ